MFGSVTRSGRGCGAGAAMPGLLVGAPVADGGSICPYESGSGPYMGLPNVVVHSWA
jgi:hypothetical protein